MDQSHFESAAGDVVRDDQARASSDRRGRRTDKCEAATAARLLSEAGPIFAAKGYDKTTLREIAAAAGTNVAAIGYHFGDKMGLYRGIVRGIRQHREAAFPIPASASADDADAARAQIGALVHTLLSRMLLCDPGSWQTMVMMREMQQPTEVFTEIVNDYFRPLFDQMTRAITILVGDRVPRQTVHQIAFSVVGQCLYYRVGDDVMRLLVSAADRRNHFDIDTLSRHITRMTLAGIEAYRCPGAD